MSCIVIAILFCVFLYAANVSERRSMDRRRSRLVARGPVDLDEWVESVPSVDLSVVEILLPLIGAGLEIPHQYLRPDDSFDVELNLKDRFWCLIADDDSRESIADIFDDRYNERPSGAWGNLRDVVVKTCSIVRGTAGQRCCKKKS